MNLCYKGHRIYVPDKCVDRFWSHATTNLDCWGWKGPTQGKILRPYVSVNGRRIYAHIFSYMLNVGPNLEGLNMCHSCDNVMCTNPSHLWQGTQFDNVMDSVRKGRNYFTSKLGFT